MKLIRPAVALVLGLAVAASGQSYAAPKKPPPCKYVTDVTGDGVTPQTANQALDLVSGDVATDKKNLTAVIRVAKLAATAPTMSPTGMSWAFTFAADGFLFTLQAGSEPTGAITYYASYEDALTGTGKLYSGGAFGTFDTAKNEVRISVPLSLIAPQATIKPGTKITDLSMSTSMMLRGPDPTARVSSGGTIFTFAYREADTAEGTKTYLAGGVTCVPVGK